MNITKHKVPSMSPMKNLEITTTSIDTLFSAENTRLVKIAFNKADKIVT